ncbi:hypothetical protein NQ315_000913 [Exocentrus adspersus]|uniref:Peptidase S1 domain-containing protein n=1 Tax=Exocentrus adspersus TaxID=1586481 RepID=A0AAV8WDI2_9CUCU|nr:hypothetical protein NQ315_000913 [Exocentrus adspersus]
MFLLLVGLAVAVLQGTGAVPLDIGGRIVNGTDADIRDYPYMISLHFNGRHTCGGSIIDEYNILTAAHCVMRDLASFSVLAGSTRMSNNGTAIPVERIIVHDGYTGRIPLEHDIAVLHLTRPLVFSDSVQPITLPSTFQRTPESSDAVLAGWGLDRTDGTVQDILQRVDIIVYPDEECERIHSSTGPTSRQFHVCAGVPEGGRGQCNGDSGGPLVVNGVEVGIVSWSVKPCTVRGFPGVFAKVSTYVDWINCNLKRV